ncbi:MAG: GNAT family N-acetyltransferase [Oscillospiraceae bacterium]|nr:GNAT family N-acetyltransferase [Oscillospiraceae bacterium]
MVIRDYLDYRESEILGLYSAVGWTAYTRDPESLREGFGRSLLTLAAYEGEELLGLIRVVGDGRTVVLVQDLLVFPQYQRRGVGSALLREVLRRYQRVRQIELVTDDSPQTLAFYKSLGFSPLSELGCVGFLRCLPANSP